MNSHRRFALLSTALPPLFLFLLALAAGLSAPARDPGPAAGKTFVSPEAAVRAFAAAVNSRDTSALAALFGPDFDDIKSPDPVQWTNELAAFAAGLDASNFKQLPTQNAPEPFHGYFFKILTRQGKHAPGGKYDYIINGHMIGGFAFVAWPAQYGDSGIMTFIINQQGKVYEKDLGPNTAALVQKMKAYDPDPSWQLSPD